MLDIIIAGAGPAGATAAFALASQGCSVLLADGLARLRHATGETLPAHTVRLLATAGIGPDPTIHQVSHGKLTCWSSDELLTTNFLFDPYGPDLRLDRGRFERDLRTAALRLGTTERRANVRVVSRQRDGWRVELDDGSVHAARWIVDATGRNASISRRLGARRERHSRHVATYAEVDDAIDARLNCTVVEAVQNGWWHATRLPSGRSVVGFHTDTETAQKLQRDLARWQDALWDTRHVGTMLRGSALRSALHSHDCSSARLSSFRGEGWVACGDAALSFDPLSGQGFHHAVAGGFSAARMIVAQLRRSEPEDELYSARLEQSWLIHQRHREHAYQSERRWKDHGFWRVAREPAPTATGAVVRHETPLHAALSAPRAEHCSDPEAEHARQGQDHQQETFRSGFSRASMNLDITDKHGIC